ncbi:MAG: BlaI/MecI/CopY family transcriptional regulator [Bacteroidetes bacterium]|nr:BlaI/MecI/CopY family transcriptional regulator [Bacteroidota bacterium]MBL7104521.1 BlaI/MecI/CopY family transcriptional regulator [Bacteroidales bacterium]
MSKQKIKPTEAELEVLQVLWNKGPSTVKIVNEKIGENKTVGYTTTLKIMQIMAEKGLVSRIKDGRNHIYSAAVAQNTAQQQLLDKLLNGVFGGSAKKLVMQTLGSNKATKEELEEIKNYIEKLEGGES